MHVLQIPRIATVQQKRNKKKTATQPTLNAATPQRARPSKSAIVLVHHLRRRTRPECDCDGWISEHAIAFEWGTMFCEEERV